MAAQVRNPDPGKNEKALIVGQELQSPNPLSGGPADPLIAWSDFPRRRSPQAQRQESSGSIMGPVSNRFADRTVPAQVMVFLEKLAEKTTLTLAFNRGEPEGGQLGQGGLDGSRWSKLQWQSVG